MMEQARQAYKQGRYPEAIRLLETQMAQAPEERTRLMLARAYEKNGQLNEARISYEALLRSSDAQIIRWAEQGLNGLLGDAIPFEALQEYCRSAPGAIAFRLKDTRVWLDENGLKIESGPSLDPAMTFPFRDLQPIIRKEDLKPIEGNAYFRVLHGQDQQLLPFETMARTVFAIPTDLPSRLVRKKLLRPEGLARLQSDIRLGETFGAALLRLNLSTLPQLIEATIGSVNLPQGYRRPFNERIGMRLAQNKQPLLKQALSQQAADPQPLGTLLLSLGIPHPKLEEALKTQAPLQGNPSLTDTPEMWLVRWGRPREDRDPRFLQRAQSVRTLLHRELLAGKHRLGNLLVEKGLISPAQLANALAWQVDQPYPLGELLAMHRVCAPEQIIESLLEQQARYRQDAEAALPPMVAPKPQVAPKKKRPPLWLGVLLVFGGSVALAWGANRQLFAWLRRPPTEYSEQGMQGRMLGGPLVHEPGALDPGGNSDQGLRVTGSIKGKVASGKIQGSFEGSAAGQFQGGTIAGFQNKDLNQFKPDAPARPETREFEGDVLNTAPLQGSLENGTWDNKQPGRLRGKIRARTFEGQEFAKLEAKLKALRSPDGKVKDPLQALKLIAEAIRNEGKRLGVLDGTFEAAMDPADVNRTSALFCTQTGEGYLESQALAPAAAEFLTAITLDPTLSSPYYHLGTIVEKGGDRRSAEAFYKRYLQVAPVGRYSSIVTSRLKTLVRDSASGRRMLN